MKAIRAHQFGEPEVLQIEEVPTPQPGPTQVLIRVHGVGINPVETYIRSGAYAKLPPLPYTPGKDAAGIVEAAGSAVTNARVGQRVYTSDTITGSYAEFTVAESSDVHPLPDNVSFAQGAGVNVPYATAYRALFQRGRAKPGDALLIHGASGGVGVAATQFARAAGLTVIGTGGSDRGRNLILENGAHHVLDHHSADYADQVMALTSGAGVNVILEMLANVNLGKDLTMLARGGRVVVIGSRGELTINPREIMIRDAEILGMILFNASPAERIEIHSAIVAGLANGTLRPVIGQELPLADVARAHRLVMEAGAFGKIVLKA